MIKNYSIMVTGIFSYLYFQLAVFIIPMPWLRIAVYFLLIGIFAFYNSFVMNKKLADLHSLSLEVAKGNYSFHLHNTKYSGPLKDIFQSIIDLKNKLLKYIFEMQVAYSQISSASQQLTVTLDESNAFAQQLYAETQEIHALNSNSYENIKSTINAVKNIVRLLESVKDTSEEMKITSIQSRQTINESLREIMEIVNSVNDIQQSTNITVKYMDKLNAATKEISHILQTVDNIAKQTHLLSLNASIESARAGVHGRGFGVVAEEIRKLSEDSKDAVSEIAALVSKITSEVSNVTHKINENLANVHKSVACSKKVEGSLNNIERTYDKVQSMIQNIIDISEEEYRLASGINNKIEAVERISQEVAAGFDMVYMSVHKQKRNLEELSSLGECLSGASQSLAILTEKADVNMLEINSSKIDSISQSIIKLLKESVLSADDILSMDPKKHQVLLDEVLAQHHSIEAIWTNDPKGRFIYSNPPAGIANAKVRDWFKESIAGKEFVSPVYISAITRNPCITVSLPIKDFSGKNIGVIGADLKLHI